MRLRLNRAGAALSRLLGHRGGGAAIEFAILSPVLFTIVLGALDVGRMFYVRQSLEYATEQASRYYTLNPTSASSAVTSYLQGQMAGGMGGSVGVNYVDTTSCNSNAAVTCTTITATYPFSFIAGYLGLGSRTLTAKSQSVRY